MDTLPFSLNIFKQLEIYQDIKRLENQFGLMLRDWKKGEYKRQGLSKNININYPTWEVERKILLWTSRYHKHLGSPITTSHLCSNNVDFLKDIHVSQTEIAFAGSENVLKNLVSRGFATWDKGALISQQGLDYGLIVDALYKIEDEDSIKEGETKYRDEKLSRKRRVFLGYELIYWTGLLVIFLSLFLLGFGFYKNLNLNIVFPSWFLCIKYLLAIISFFPAVIFVIGISLIKLKK